MARTGIIGAGSWACGLAYVLLGNGHEVTMWSAVEKEVEMLREYSEQKEKLPGVILEGRFTVTGDLAEAVRDKDLIVMAVPSLYVRETARKMQPLCRYGQLIVSVAKGIEDESLMLLSDVIREELPSSRIVVLSGPTHAEEVGKGLPTAIVAGSASEEDSRYVQDIFMNEVFRVYTSSDITGIQTGGALKNVVALAAGCADGLGYGDNTKAALITRGMNEITRLGCAMGGRPETFAGLTGIGDLIVTCASMHSRNRRAGILIGRGYSAEDAMKEVSQVVEGVYSARAAYDLSQKYGVEMPIVNEIYQVLFEGKAPAEAVRNLMMRDKKDENGGTESGKVNDNL